MQSTVIGIIIVDNVSCLIANCIGDGASICSHIILDLSLALTVLAVNIMGDGLRDTLDPKMAKRAG